MAINYVVSYTFSPSTTISSSQVNQNFSDNANTWTGLEAKTKSFAALQIDATPTAAADVVRKDYVDSLMPYRRPVLQYNSGTVVNIETGINGTSGQARILFPDGTLRTDSTTGRINCNIAQVASLTGTAQSGLRTGTVVSNTWYAVYAVKSQVNSTDIVSVADTVLPVQASFSTLNTNFGTSGWVYLGMMRYGDGATTGNAIVSFIQAGNLTIFNNNSTVGNAFTGTGPRFASTAGATSLLYTYSSGTAGAVIPSHIPFAYWAYAMVAGSGTAQVRDGGDTLNFVTAIGTALFAGKIFICSTTGIGLKNGSSVAMDIFLSGFVDSVLGVGANPIL